MDGSAACGSGAAVCGVDVPSLPSLLYTPPCTREEFSIPVHSQELQQRHYPLFPMGFPQNVFQLS